MLDHSLVIAVAYYVAWSHLTSGYAIQTEAKRHSGISVKHVQEVNLSLWRQIPAHRHIPVFIGLWIRLEYN